MYSLVSLSDLPLGISQCILSSRFPLRPALGDKPMLMDEIGREVRLLEADVPAGKSAVYVIDKVRLGFVKP